MDILWDDADHYLQVRHVAERLPEDLAYTTVMTFLARLHTKGLLRRVQRGRAWAYRPKVSRGEYAARAMATALGRSADVDDALLRFVGRLSTSDQATLRAILVQEGE